MNVQRYSAGVRARGGVILVTVGLRLFKRDASLKAGLHWYRGRRSH